MKIWLSSIFSGVVVFVAFGLANAIHPDGWRLLALWGAMSLLYALFVPKYPKEIALKWGINLRKGQVAKVEVEGK